MQFFSHYGLFLLETITIVVAVLICVAGIVAISFKGKDKSKSKLTITPLNKKYTKIKQKLASEIYPKKEYKKYIKADKLKQKDRSEALPKLFVLHFNGDMRASAVDNLREEISAILTTANSHDEVLVTIDSGGGMVHTYGLASSQLQRLKDRHIPLTVCVDKIAASGGYMMACVANKILAAPFAIIGSIGVVAQLPNLHRYLKKKNIDVELLTAGEYKRTLTVLGENTDKGRKKFQEDLESIHQLFKQHVNEHRSQVDIARVATGEHWYAKDALSLNLVDSLMTSDDYILRALPNFDVYQLEYKIKPTVTDKLLTAAMQLRASFIGQ